MNRTTVGRIVLYVLPSSKGAGEIRPAIVVRVWTERSVNLQVFADGDGSAANDGLPATNWITSATLDQAGKMNGTWHWPERS